MIASSPRIDHLLYTPAMAPSPHRLPIPIPAYVSPRSANALISDLAPASLTAEALLHLNLVLDELVGSLVAAAASIAPGDIKTRAVGKVFANVTTTTTTAFAPSSPKPRTLRTRRNPSLGHQQQHFHAVSTSLQVTTDAAALALGREAINEAELEVKAWRDARRGGKVKAEDGFEIHPGGLRRDRVPADGPFPVVQAVNILRCKIMTYSASLRLHRSPRHDPLTVPCSQTLGNDKPETETVRWLMDAWARSGGSTRDDVLDPSALYFTAIIE